MKSNKALLIFLLLATSALYASAKDEAKDVSKLTTNEISIRSVQGETTQPLKATTGKATVLIFSLADCPISNAYSPELKRIQTEFSKKEIPFYIVYTDPDRTKDEITTHLKDYSLDGFTAIHDKAHTLVKAVGARVTPEAVVIDSQGNITYRGRINDRYAGYGKRRQHVSEHNLKDAINAALAGKRVAKPRVKALGCFIPTLD